MSRITTAVFAGLLALSTTACSIDVARNGDGSLQIDSSIAEENLNSEIALALEDTDLTDVEVAIVADHLEVAGFRPHPDGSGGDVIEFRVDLGVAEGHLAVTVSEVTAAGRPLSDDVISRWNERLADRLERAADRHPDSTLESVEVGAGSVTFSWRVETRHGS